jgi:hypothetical protein
MKHNANFYYIVSGLMLGLPSSIKSQDAVTEFPHVQEWSQCITSQKEPGVFVQDHIDQQKGEFHCETFNTETKNTDTKAVCVNRHNLPGVVTKIPTGTASGKYICQAAEPANAAEPLGWQPCLLANPDKTKFVPGIYTRDQQDACNNAPGKVHCEPILSQGTPGSSCTNMHKLTDGTLSPIVHGYAQGAGYYCERAQTESCKR